MGQWLFRVLLLIVLAVTQGVEVVIPKGEHHIGAVATVSEPIRIEGVVAGDVTSWSGNILVTGRVEGDVVSYTGNVDIAPGAQVTGSALALAGTLRVSEPAALAGEPISGGTGGRLAVNLAGAFGSSPSLPAGIANLGRLLAAGVGGVLLLGLSIMFLGAWPLRSAAAAATLRNTPGSSSLLGIAFTIAMALLTGVLSLLIAATVLGAPLAAILMILVHVLCVHGFAVLVQVARQSLSLVSQRNPLAAAAVIASALVTPIVLLAVISPALGLLAFYLLSAPGLGALVLSRGGTLALAPAR